MSYRSYSPISYKNTTPAFSSATPPRSSSTKTSAALPTQQYRENAKSGNDDGTSGAVEEGYSRTVLGTLAVWVYGDG